MPNSPTSKPINFLAVFSALGYGMLPVALFTALSLFLRIHTLTHCYSNCVASAQTNIITSVIALVFVSWSTAAASGILANLFGLGEQRLLLAYPMLLYYSYFVLVAIF